MSDFRYEIALPLLHGVGLTNAKHLIDHYGSAEMVFNQGDELLRKLAKNADVTADKRNALAIADKELEFIARHNIKTYYYQNSDYPFRLKECVDAPILLYGLGNFDFNCEHVVSVVGTRMPSDRGKEWCKQFVSELATLLPDTLIVSGLAYGIDVTAHRAAIDSGLPTLIIPAHGLDRIYPSAHRNVAMKALDNGGILTEYKSGTTPERVNFVARNRIIAGLADAVVVAESKDKGGSLITAEMANSYSREVFACPGRVSDEQSRGCNRLIKTHKAHMVESASDLIDAMMWNPQNVAPVQTEMFVELTEEENLIMDALHQSADGMHVNQLLQEVKMSFAGLSALLFTMEMKGLLKSLPGAMYRALK